MEFVAKTDVGKKRTNNEDCYFAQIYDDNIALYIVADGLGGYEGGEVASKILTTKMSRYFEEHLTCDLTSKENVVNIIKQALQVANTEIYNLEKTDQKYKGMGTTVVVIAIIYDKIYYLSVGDSRIYYIDDKIHSIKQITEDDTYVNTLIKTNVITENEAKTHPQKHVLTKAVGIFKQIDASINILDVNDGYLLLCTDGMTNMLIDTEVLEIIKKNKFECIAEKLVQRSNNNGGVDNITVIVVKL